jgi:hypothetical protein
LAIEGREIDASAAKQSVPAGRMRPALSRSQPLAMHSAASLIEPALARHRHVEPACEFDLLNS